MAKHKYIKTPEELWQLFEDYRKEVKGNPRIKVEYVGKEGERVKTPIERPLIIEGFKVYCYEHIGTVDHYFKNTDGAYEDYRPIITRIRETIRNEQIDGGMVGCYNSNLTARLNNLKEQTENTNNNNINLLNIDPLDDSADDSTKKDSKS